MAERSGGARTRAIALVGAITGAMAWACSGSEPAPASDPPPTAEPPSSLVAAPPPKTTTSAPLDGGIEEDANPPPLDHTPSPGCGHATADSGFVPGKMIVSAGNDRTYDIFIPPGYDSTKPTSVIVVFHADAPISLRPYLPIEAASTGQAIVVYPYGFDAWDLSASTKNYDFTFIDTLLTSLKATYCVDPARVFAYGYSNGGFFLNMYACHRGPSAFRAIAVNSSGIYTPEGEVASYDPDGNIVCPKPPVAALVIHGTEDKLVDYATDGIGARDLWLAGNGCQSTTTETTPSPCVTYTCAKNPVEFCPPTINHQIWSSAATAAWSFFSKL